MTPLLKSGFSSLAKRKGLSTGAALEAAGITRRYFSRPQEGRSTNLILNLARVLDVPPATLFGLDERSSDAPAIPLDSEKLKRIAVAARMMTAQVAALVYVASDPSDADPAALMELVMDKVNGLNAVQPSSERSGKSR
jgi:hypothetical protein